MKLDSSQLQNVCTAVTFERPHRNRQLAHELLRLMKKERGMGLAANQCGLNVRLFVMCVEDRYYHCFNPEIVQVSDQLATMPEGCLSYPAQVCEISRPQQIQVKYYSADGEETVEWLDGWAARCFQHELDHLNGLTMFDR